MAECTKSCVHPEYQKQLVFFGFWDKTSSGLTKRDLTLSSTGKVVSLARSERGKQLAAEYGRFAAAAKPKVKAEPKAAAKPKAKAAAKKPQAKKPVSRKKKTVGAGEDDDEFDTYW